MANKDNFLDTLPEGYEEQMADVSRQRKLAEILMSKGLQQPQGEMVSGYYIKPSWTQQLAPLANMVAGLSVSNAADSERAKIASLIRKGKAEVEGKIIDEMTPRQVAIEMAGPYGGNVPMPTEVRDIGPNYANAAKLIRTNAYGAGKEFLPQIIKNMAPEKPNSVLEYEYAQKDPRYANYSMAQKKASAPNMTAITNVKNFEPFANKAQTEMGSALVKNFDTLQNIPNQIQTLDKVAELAPKSFAGSLAQQKLDAAKFLNNNLGLNVAPDKMVNTEVLNTVLFTNIMDNLKKMDAQPSQFQQQEMKQGLGNIGTDPTALPKVIDVYKQILIGKASEHNRRVKEAETGEAKMKFPYSIYVPVEGANSGGNTVDFNSLKPKR